MSILDNVGQYVKPGEDDEFCAEDDQFATEYPAIFEFLARIKHQGRKRAPGRLIIYYVSGKAQIMLADKHTGSCAFHVAESVSEGLEGVNKRLSEPKGMDWRVSKGGRY